LFAHYAQDLKLKGAFLCRHLCSRKRFFLA
jgi:hypothetical protein